MVEQQVTSGEGKSCLALPLTTTNLGPGQFMDRPGPAPMTGATMKHRPTTYLRWWLYLWHRWRQKRAGMAFLVHENCARAVHPDDIPIATNMRIEVWSDGEEAPPAGDLPANEAQDQDPAEAR